MAGSLIWKWGVLGAVVLAGLLLQAPSAHAQGVMSKDGVYMDGAKHCPARWNQGKSDGVRRHNFCYPSYANSPKVYRTHDRKCASGYGLDWNEWCVEGHVEHPELARANVMSKAHDGDRCPAGFHSYMDKCTTDYDQPSTARLKGAGACRAGEIAEWGIWCTSNYEHLTVQQMRGAHIRDWNNIAGKTGYPPRQQPDSEAASEVYQAMFGEDRLDGPTGMAASALVNKRPLTAEQRTLLENANPATAATLPPADAAGSSGAAGEAAADGQDAKPGCKPEGSSRLRGKLGQIARQLSGC